jgi:enoyl-CoA hydratase
VEGVNWLWPVTFDTASDNARFGQPEVNLGLIPGYGGTQRLTHLVGKGKAMEMMLSGNMIEANEAKQVGLVNMIMPLAELLDKTYELAQIIKSKAPAALSHVIRLVNMASQGDPSGLQKEAEAFGNLFDTSDAKEGRTAFFEKRKPIFKGE